jgi:hypothetical protein
MNEKKIEKRSRTKADQAQMLWSVFVALTMTVVAFTRFATQKTVSSHYHATETEHSNERSPSSIYPFKLPKL